MICLPVLVVVSLAGALGEELTARATIRFPADDYPSVNSGPDAYQAESQASQVLVQPTHLGKSHFLIPQSPSLSHPFGEPNSKGYSQGYILPQQYPSPPLRQENEFHHTIPPPLKATTYGPPRPVAPLRQKPINNFNRQPERHRFGPQRYPYHQLPKVQQGQYPTMAKPLFSPKPQLPQIKDTKSQLSEAIYKYTVVNQPEPPRKHGYDPEYLDIFNKPDFKGNRDHEIPVVKGNPDYMFKGPNFHREEFPPHLGVKYHKNKYQKENLHDIYQPDEDVNQHFQKQKKPFLQAEESRYPAYLKESKFPTKLNRFPEYPEPNYVKQGEKPYIPIKENVNEYYFPEGTNFNEENTNENKSKYSQNKYKGPILDQPAYDMSQINVGNNYNENQFPYAQNQGDFNAQKPYPYRSFDDYSSDKSGSEWTPINAPEGAVPAKSYDIPAPDLSRIFYSGNPYGKVEDERIKQRAEQPTGNKYRKTGNSEEVVSAVVMVKQ